MAGDQFYESEPFGDVVYIWIRSYAADGTLRWTDDLRQEPAYVDGICTDAAGDVYVNYVLSDQGAVSRDAKLLELDGQTGLTLWRRHWIAPVGPFGFYEGTLTCTELGPVVANVLPPHRPPCDVRRVQPLRDEPAARGATDE